MKCTCIAMTDDPGSVHMPHCAHYPHPVDVERGKAQKGDDRSIAQKVIEKALDVVMKQRRDQHGDAENSFAMIAEMWSTYVQHRFPEGPVDLTPGDVAFMMVLLKVARASYGNKTFDDHYVDIAGYTSLAAMLNGVKV